MKAVLAATAAVLLAAAPVRAAGPYVNGTYTTPTQSGGITFKPTRAVVQYGYEGTFVVGGRSHPGSLYAVRGTGNVGLVWYYGTTGIPAGSALLVPAGGTAYTGTITFTDRRGAVTDSGTVTASIVVK